MTGTAGSTGRTYLPAKLGTTVAIWMAAGKPRSQLLGQTMTSRKATLYGLLGLIFLHLQPVAQAQYVTDEAVTGDASGTLYSAVVPLAFPRSFLFARGDFGDRPGVSGDYFSAGGFMPAQFHGPDEVFFIEGQFWITEEDNGSVSGGTFGIGNRWLIRDFSQLVGINAFAAWDQAGSGNNYDGAGVGVEWLSDYLGVTANAYIPWDSDRVNQIGPSELQADAPFFTGTNLAFTTLTPVEEQLLGFDIEVGSPIPRAEWISAYAGAYYFDAEEGNEFSGVSGRVQADFTNAVVSVNVSDDDRFGTSVNITGELRLGDGPLNFAPRSRNLDRQMFDRVRRQSRIATLRYMAETSELAINPATGLPFEFLHVDNTVAPGGDGSFENRFNELNLASNMPIADIILAYRGDTTFGGNHLDANGGLFLEDNQIVVGEGYDFTIITAQFPGQPISLPNFGDGGINPFISGDNNSNLINLADNNQILGLNLLPAMGGSAIAGTNINNVTIDEINRDLDLLGGSSTGPGAGIVLTNASGIATITNSGFNISDNTAAGGVVITNTNTADLAVLISNDLIEFPNLAYIGGNAGISLTGINSNIDAIIENIVNNSSNTGLQQNASLGGNVDVNVTDSIFENSIGDNFAANMNGGTGTTALTGTSLANAGQDAIDIFADNGAAYSLTLTDSSGDDATQNGILALIQGGSTVTLNATNSTFDDAANGSGIDVTVMEASTFTGSITNGSFDRAGANAVALDVQDAGSNGMLTLTNTSGTNAGADAINISASDASAINNAVATLVLTNSTEFNNATDDGLQISNTGATVNVSADATPNSIVDFSNFVNGMGLNSVSTGSGAITNITFTDGASFDNVLGNMAQDAIFIQSDNGANTTFIGSAVSGMNAGQDGIQLSSSGGTITTTISAAGSFANAGQAGGIFGDGIFIDNNNNGDIILNLDGAANGIVDFTNALTMGLRSISDGAGTTTTLNFNDGANFSMAGLDAINISSSNGAVTDVNGSNMLGTNAGDNALELFAIGANSVVDINFTGTNNFSDATNHGIVANNLAGGRIDVNIGNANFSDLAGGQVGQEGLLSIADGMNTITNFTFTTGASFDNVGLDAISLNSSGGAVTTLTGSSVSGDAAGDDGLDLRADGGTVNVTLTNTGSFADAVSNGLEFDGLNNGLLNINISGVGMTPADFSGAGENGIIGSLDASTANLTLNNTNFSNPITGDGMLVDALNNSTFTANVSNTTFDNAVLGNAIDLSALTGSTITFTGNTVSGVNAGLDAINLTADDSTLDFTITNAGDFSGAGISGMNYLATNQSTLNVNVSGSAMTPANFSGAGAFGLIGTLDNSMGLLTLANVNFNGTLGADAINLNALNGSVQGLNLDDVTGNNAFRDGLALNTNNSTIMGAIDNVSFTGAGRDGLSMTADDANPGDAIASLINVTLGSAGGNTANFNDATRDGLRFNLNNGAMIIADTNNLTANNAGQSGAILGVGDAINVVADNMSMLNLDITNGSLLNAFDDMTDVTFMNGAIVDILIDPTPATGAGDNGLVFNGATGGQLIFTMVDSPLSTAADPVGNNGVLGTLNNATANLTFTNSDINTDGTSNGDGVNVTATNASSFSLALNNSDVAGWSNTGMGGGNGIIVDLNASMANVIFSGAGTDISNAGVNAIDIFAGNGSTANVDLGTNGLNLDGAGNTGLVLISDGAGSLITVDGDEVSASNTGNLGFDLLAVNGGDIALTGADNLGLNNWVADGNAIGGLSILADGLGSNVFGRFNGLTTINSGDGTTDGSFGIQITALDQAQIGTRASNTAGLTFNNTVSGNFDGAGDPDFANLTQDHALLVNVDDRAFAGLIFNNSEFDANQERGVIVHVNEDLSALDTALASVLFNGGTINNNGGDGVLLISDEANVTQQNIVGQSGGINARFQNIDIRLNSNFFPQPVAPALVPNAAADGDANGFGVFVRADENGNDPLGPGLININFDNANLGDNEEGEFGNDGGSIINVSFNNMNLNTPIQICADMADMTQIFNDVTISGLTGDQAAISIHASNGFTADATFNNVTIRDVEAQAVAILSDGVGSSVIANFNGLTIDNAGYGTAGTTMDTKTGLLLEGVIQGSVLAGASAEINLSGVTIDNVDGMTDLNMATTIGVNAIDFEVDGAGATLDLNIAPANGLGGLTVVGGSTTAGNQAGAPALEGEIDVELTGGAQATINLGDINIANSDSLGINLTDDGNVAGGFIITGLDDIQATGAAQTGFNLDGNLIDNGMVMTPTEVNLTNSNFSGAGADGVNIDVNATGDTDFTFTNVTANTTGGDGLALAVNGLSAGANASVNVAGSSFNGASGGDGIRISLDGDATSTGDVSITGTTATGAMNDGLNITGNMNVDITAITLGNAMNGVDFSGAGGNGVQIDLANQANPTDVIINNLAANNTGGLGVDINLTNIDGGDSTVSLTNSMVNNTMMAAGGGIDINLTNVNDSVNAGTQTITINNVSAQGAAGADGLNVDVSGLDANETLALTIGNGSNFSNNGLGGVDLNITGTDTTLIELDVNGLTVSDNLLGDGFNFATTMGENVNVLNFANVTANTNNLDGIDLSFAGNTGSTVTFDPNGTFATVSAQNNQRNGLKIEVADGSTFGTLADPFSIAGLNLSNNGQGGAQFDALDIQVHDVGSTAFVDFSGITINNTLAMGYTGGGRGVDADVFNGASLNMNLSGTITNTGLEGVDINVGQFDEFNQAMVNSTGNFTGILSDLTISNSGQNLVFTGDNLNIFVTGNGAMNSSTANVTLDNVDALNSVDADGIDIDILNGANAIVSIQNGSSGSNNAVGAGLTVLADGATTTFSMLMDDSLPINSFNNNGQQGVLVNLTNGVMVNNLEVFASASGNGGNGIEINANDGTGVTINTLDIAGAQANNNMGSGLVVNLNAVNGINDFTLSNAAFSGNMGDQVFLGFQNMMLTDLTINNVDVTGNALSSDGLHINLLDTMVSNLSITDLVATNNGQNGLNLVLDESALDGATTTSIGTGFITASQFIGNAAQFNRADAIAANNNFAGVLISLTDDATADFDIFENPNGFLNNQGIGLNIQVNERAQFALDNVNSQVPGAGSFYANDFIGNGGFGFLLEANEAIPLPPDAFGPQYNLVLGDIGFDPNTFTGNADAAVAIIGSADSTGSFSIVNSILENTVNGAGGGDARFNGDGLAIRLEDNAILTDLMIDGAAAGLSLNNNLGSGLNVSIDTNSMLGTNSRMTVINSTIMGNQRHGIEISRLDGALFGPNAASDQILIGTAGNGNTIVGTATSLDGINIFNGNMSGTPQALDIRITENTISSVRDGVFVQQVGNSQMSGAMTDNMITGVRQDGINIRLDQDAALGDPVNVAGFPNPPVLNITPNGAPYVFAGNQILNSGQHGIFFDTNSTVELGAFSGGAFANALITGGNVNARSLIQGSTGDGIRIQDNSDNFNSLAASQNTYTITQSDLRQNNDGVRAIVGQAGTVLGANNGIALNIGNTAAVNRFDVIIEENRDDGIDLQYNDADNVRNRFNFAQTTIRNNGFAGDGEDSRVAGLGHGVEVDLTNQGTLTAVVQNVDVLNNAADGFDFGVNTNNIEGTASNVTVVDFTMTGTNILGNGQRGFESRLFYDPFAGILGANSGEQDGYNSIWRIGQLGGALNDISQNGDEGLVFDLQAQGFDPDTVSVNAAGIQTDQNNDVFVDVNRPFTPGQPLRSTQHPVIATGSTSGLPVQESRRRIVAQVDVINNVIQNNGQDLDGLGAFRLDGLVFGIGNNTLLRSTIAGNAFGGNNGDDIRLYAQRSSGINPPNSVNNNPAAQINGNNQNFFVHDPVAYVDLVFGSVLDNAGNVIASPGNTGDQISIQPSGSNATSNTTTDGFFTNADPIKGGGRSVFLAGLIQVNGVFQNTAINNFNQNAVQQVIAPQFNMFVPHGPGSPYPALTFPAISFP